MGSEAGIEKAELMYKSKEKNNIRMDSALMIINRERGNRSFSSYLTGDFPD